MSRDYTEDDVALRGRLVISPSRISNSMPLWSERSLWDRSSRSFSCLVPWLRYGLRGGKDTQFPPLAVVLATRQAHQGGG